MIISDEITRFLSDFKYDSIENKTKLLKNLNETKFKKELKRFAVAVSEQYIGIDVEFDKEYNKLKDKLL